MVKQKSMGTSFEDDFDIEFEDEFDMDVEAELDTEEPLAGAELAEPAVDSDEP